MLKTVRNADLRSLQVLINLYEKAAPIIRRIANLESLNYGELPVTPYALVESNLTLRMVLSALRKMSEPKDKILVAIRKEFENAILNCIRAADAAEKYSELAGDRSDKGKLLLMSIINYTVLAHEYIESVAQKLETSSAEIRFSKADVCPDSQHGKEDIGWKPASPILISTEQSLIQKGINSIAYGIESGLDKLGDIITLPIAAVAKLLVLLSTSSRGRKNRHK